MHDTPKQVYRRRWGALKKERSTYDQHWRQLSDYMLPRRGKWLVDDQRKGSKRNDKIINDRATMAARTLASGLMTGITSPARPWFKLGTPDPDLSDHGRVRVWLEEVRDLMLEVFARSNLYTALPLVYLETGVFGTGGMLAPEHTKDVLRFYPLTVGSYCIAQGEDLTVNTVYREVQMTVGQMVQRFGLEHCSDNVREAWNRGHVDEWRKVLHVMEPNDERNPLKLDKLNKPVRSVYLEEGGNDDGFLSESGFDEFIGMFPRWVLNGEDIYGSSPGMDALGDCKALQIYEERKAEAIEKNVRPPMKGPTSLRNKASSVLPGGMTYVDEGTQGKFEPAMVVQPAAIAAVEDSIFQHEQRISRSFYEDLFVMISQLDRRQITAREIDERREEKLLMLGPVLERLEDELLDPLIDRTFNVMMRKDLLPPPPPELQGEDLRVEYISILHQAQRAVGMGALEAGVAFTQALSATHPEARHAIKAKEVVEAAWDMLGAPPKALASEEEFESAMAAEQQQQAAMAMAEQAPGIAQAAKAASEADMGGGENVLQRMLP